MTVRKFEEVQVNLILRGVDASSDMTETLQPLFTTVGEIAAVKKPLELKEFYREYNNFEDVTLHYTPATYGYAQNINNYAFTIRGKNLRLLDVKENGRESITFTCYSSNQTIAL